MDIDLNRFSEEREVVAPVVRGCVNIGGRVTGGHGREDGFYKVALGDKVTFKSKASLIETHQFLQNLPILRGIAYGDSIIPINFSQAKDLGLGETIPVNFLNAELGTVIITRRWDRALLYDRESASKQQMLVLELKRRATSNEPIGSLLGVTPEMRYFYLLLSMDMAHMQEWKELDELALSETERQKRIKQFEDPFSGRLKKTIEDAGGILVRFNKKARSTEVIWKIGGEEFNSTIKQDFRVLELGFCADGHDKDHSIASAVILAKEFINDGLIYKTRY